MALEITDNNFKEVIATDKPVVVDFWAPWCGPCRMVGPIVEEASETYKDKAIVGKLNVDDNPETSSQFGVRSIPTILFFKNGEVADKHIGVISKSDLEAKVNSLL